MKRERESDELILNAPPPKKMKSSFFEEFMQIPYDVLNMAFRILEDGDDLDSDVERVLDEGYDW
jgi:hypothetical protein